MSPFSPLLSARSRHLNSRSFVAGPIVYWVSRDQRWEDNWAVWQAVELARQSQQPLVVVFVLQPGFLGAPARAYDWMFPGLATLATAANRAGVPFVVTLGDPAQTVAALVKHLAAGAVVTDFSPLRLGRQWRQDVARVLPIPLIEVDAHNIIPAWVVSPKLEVAARTLRPKVQRLLPEYLTDFPAGPTRLAVAPAPSLERQLQLLPWLSWQTRQLNWSALRAELTLDEKVPAVGWLPPGSAAGRQRLTEFVEQQLLTYATDRNDPSKDGQSNLSPYLHFGQLAAQRAALAVQAALRARPELAAGAAAFLEELIVRRELSDNFCLYQSDYDQPSAWPAWAQRTLDRHRSDPRPVSYSFTELEAAQTHDPAWNLAQQQLVTRGKVHGYLRMYWAKKILEWTASPEEALQQAILLNDKYLLDGRDPNGYAGIQWSIGGVHDRPWFERPIFGQIRYMNLNGLRRKFNLDALLAHPTT